MRNMRSSRRACQWPYAMFAQQARTADVRFQKKRCSEQTIRDLACRVVFGTCEDQLRNPQTAEVCFSVSHAGRDSSFGAKFDPEPNRLLQCHLRRLATTQHHSAPSSHQRCCESKSLTTSQP